jgi:hypothetical protein
LSVRVERSIPFVLALVVLLTSMRGLEPLRFKQPDAAKHMLNGAFLHDFVRSGEFTHPMSFAKQFYVRFPAITIPYHPPVFASIQALFFAAFGVNFFAARLSVAVAAGVSAFLLYRLIDYTHRSAGLAIAATLIFISTQVSQLCATDVMPEFPALAFMLGALYCLRDLGTGYPPSRAYPFALLAGAAVWTKQHAVFLGVVPFIFIILRGNWRSLRGLHLWVSSLLFGSIVLALTRLSVPVHSAGVTNQFTGVRDLWGTILYNAESYAVFLYWYIGLPVSCWILISAAVFVASPRLRGRPEEQLYIAWILAIVPLLLLTAKHDIRYFYLALPAFFVLGCDGIRLACRRLIAVRYFPAVTGLMAAGLILFHTYYASPPWFHGGTIHLQLARAVKDRASRRLIYCGENIAFLAVWSRVFNPDSRTIMIRGEKLDRAIFTAKGFEQFAWRFGVDTVVIDTEVGADPWRRPRPWDFLVVHPTASMVRYEVLTDSENCQRKILIYDFTNPSPEPESALDIPVSGTAGSLNLSL